MHGHLQKKNIIIINHRCTQISFALKTHEYIYSVSLNHSNLFRRKQQCLILKKRVYMQMRESGRGRERDRLRNYRRTESMKRGKMKEKEREEGRKWGEKKIQVKWK